VIASPSVHAVTTKPPPGIGALPGDVNIVWTPPWNPSMMTEDAKLELGIL